MVPSLLPVAPQQHHVLPAFSIEQHKYGAFAWTKQASYSSICVSCDAPFPAKGEQDVVLTSWQTTHHAQELCATCYANLIRILICRGLEQYAWWSPILHLQHFATKLFCHDHVMQDRDCCHHRLQ